ECSPQELIIEVLRLANQGFWWALMRQPGPQPEGHCGEIEEAKVYPGEEFGRQTQLLQFQCVLNRPFGFASSPHLQPTVEVESRVMPQCIDDDHAPVCLYQPSKLFVCTRQIEAREGAAAEDKVEGVIGKTEPLAVSHLDGH